MFRKFIFPAAIVLGGVALSASLSVAHNWHSHQAAQDQLNGPRPHDLGLDSAEPDGLSITRQNWRREGGFLIAEMTVANKKQFPVEGVIVACDFFTHLTCTWGGAAA
jgi:hypothetical protein